MGGGSWDTDVYKSATRTRAATGVADFGHDEDVRMGLASGVHPDLDPLLIKGVRESRDSAEHPESTAVMVVFDVTGSMRTVPKTLQKKLEGLMDTVTAKARLKDVQICYAAVGDSFSDQFPFQVGQFESDNRSDEQLRKVILEGNGGGGNHESYPLGLYCAARKTSIDCFEKRGKKGYLFTIGDEKSYTHLTKREVEQIFGDTVGEDIALKQLICEVAERWEHFHIIPTNTDYRGDPGVRAFWKELLTERVVRVDDEALICEVIAGLIQMLETTADADAVVKGMGLVGVEGDAVKNALVPVSRATAPAHVAKGGLPTGHGKSKGSVSRV